MTFIELRTIEGHLITIKLEAIEVIGSNRDGNAIVYIGGTGHHINKSYNDMLNIIYENSPAS